MTTIPHIAEGIFLIAGTVAIHSAGTATVLWVIFRYKPVGERHFGFVNNTAAITILVLALLLIHLVEVACWAGFYYNRKCFPDLRTAVYFSLTSYSTVGYGDVLLGQEWRMLGGVEALTGMLMVSWSTALMLGQVTWICTRLMERWTKP